MAKSTQTPWDRIKEAMAAKGINPTQVECAKLIDVTQPSVSEWASGTTAPSLENSRALAAKLNVCVEWILTGKGPKRPGPPMDPHSQALWDAWMRIPTEDRGQVVGYAESKARPSQRRAQRLRSAPPGHTDS